MIDLKFTRRRAFALTAGAAGVAAGLGRPSAVRAADLPAAPDPAGTIHLVGDLHFGAFYNVRRDELTADLLGADVPQVLHLQMGDATESATPAQDDAYFAWRSTIGGQWHGVLGNHDLYGGRSAQAWETRYGQPRNGVLDLGFCRLVHVAPDAITADKTSIVLSAKTLKWLDQQLELLAGPVVIACHAPLQGTVLGPTTGPGAQYSSLEAGFHAQPAKSIQQILARRPAVKAWIAAHTHSDISAPGLITTADVGKRKIVSINASALSYTGRTHDIGDPLRSLYLSIHADRFEIRVRDHRLRAWGDINGVPVTVVPMPA